MSVVKYLAPRLLAYHESNLPFYKKGAALVDAAYALELQGDNQWEHSLFYDVGWDHNASVRNANTHGRCSEGKVDCHHCRTIDAARIACEEGPLFC